MEKQSKETLILWLKRLLGIAATGVWISIIYSLLQTDAPFADQAPLCIAGTMVTFGILSAAYKGLDYWQLNHKKESK